jgi:RHS repeat-associated protein
MAGFGEADARAARDNKLAQIGNELLLLPPEEQARAMDAALAELGGAEDGADFFVPTLDDSGQSISGGEFTAESGSGGGSAAQSSASTVLWLLADNLGTTCDVIDNTGVLVNHITYAAFGAITAVVDAAGQPLTQSATRYFYTQREFDFTTHLNYHRARYYDPSAGRWLSEDPISFSAGDTNLVRYVRNSPTLAVDAAGHQPQDSFGGANANGHHQPPKGDTQPFEGFDKHLGNRGVPITARDSLLLDQQNAKGAILAGEFEIAVSVVPNSAKGGQN